MPRLRQAAAAVAAAADATTTVATAAGAVAAPLCKALPLQKGSEVNQLHCQSSLLLQWWPTASLARKGRLVFYAVVIVCCEALDGVDEFQLDLTDGAGLFKVETSQKLRHNSIDWVKLSLYMFSRGDEWDTRRTTARTSGFVTARTTTT
jgi:hypothetical protein